MTRSGLHKLSGVATNTELISVGELKKAACSNLGESFNTNPSVDVSYTDASTGARQIKLLGLAGTYVQMLTENVPNFRGSAIPYLGRDYVFHAAVKYLAENRRGGQVATPRISKILM